MELRDRITEYIKALPLAHRVVIVGMGALLVMGGVLFAQWITSPSYTVLYANLDDPTVAQVISELETAGIPYQLEAGGSRVLVPRDQLYRTRANLASSGISGSPTPKGYELLDEQGLNVSDFRQRVDFKRALEGELAKTLAAMDQVNAATVHLVIPERVLFEEAAQPPSASVMLDTRGELSPDEVDTVAFLVSSAVEGLEPDQVTVADINGRVLHAPGDAAGAAGVTNRQLRHTREFEQALAGDIGNLLERITGDRRASVVVRAELGFDETTTESETFDPASAVATREQIVNEIYLGTQLVPGGLVGVDGGAVTDGGETDYTREESVREFGVDRIVETTVSAPGGVEQISVAIVMDDGSLTGAPVPPVAEIEELVTAALALDPARGDSLAVSTLPFPTVPETDLGEETGSLLDDLLPRALGVLVLLIVSIGLFLMTRGRRLGQPDAVWGPVELGSGMGAGGALGDGGLPLELAAPEEDADATLQADVHELVQRQPEEIAALLRSWLADSR